MNDEAHRGPEETGNSEERGREPNLALIYGLIALAMLAAIVVAALVVLPFYHRR
jgi:hypothetical protein